MKQGLHYLYLILSDTSWIVSFQTHSHQTVIQNFKRGNFVEVVAEKSSQNWHGKLTKGVLFNQKNSPTHKSVVAMAAKSGNNEGD